VHDAVVCTCVLLTRLLCVLLTGELVVTDTYNPADENETSGE
jgi:hypothetical protein